jgi:succinoglycan biosynthesis transport protein ExoP
MTIIRFVEILMSKIKYLVILPLLAGVLTFILTRDLPVKYAAETSIFTGITSNTGLEVSATRVDKIVTQNEYNNVLTILKSESVYEEIALRLLAQHLTLNKPKKEIISEVAFEDLENNAPAEVKNLVVINNYERTYQNLKNYIKADQKNFLYNILNYENQYYSYKALSTIKVEQINSSDIIQLSYESDDPGISYNTLKIAAKVFISNYGLLKKNQKSSAVKYFQDKLDEVSKKLNNAEDELLRFNTSNNIINYYEQTKQITTQHEEIELRLQDAKMKNESSVAVLNKIETEIKKRYSINFRNIEILNIRKKLVDCNTEIAQLEIQKKDNGQDVSINLLYKNRIVLEKKLENCIDSIYNFKSNSEGIESRKILDNWLDAVKDLESTTAIYKSMQIRQLEFQIQFKRYAPLGSTTKRIEREINVYESEYLEILNDLNAALQNEQNTDMISNMRITDEAKFPINAIPSKKKLYVLISVLFTLIFYILGVFCVELMDHRIKTPSKIKLLTGLDFLGAFCLINPPKSKSNIDLQIQHKAELFIFEKIRSISLKEKKPFIIQVLSIWEDAEKSKIAEILNREIETKGFKSKVIETKSMVSNDYLKNSDEPNLYNFYKANEYNSLLSDEDKKNDYIIIIIPAIAFGIDNPVLLQNVDMSLIVFDSDLTWTKADNFNVEKIKKLIPINLYSVLSNALPENLEEIYGEIPKKRSKFRILVKKILKRIS